MSPKRSLSNNLCSLEVGVDSLGQFARIADVSLPSPIRHSAMRTLDEQEKAIVRRLIRDPRESDNGVGELTGVNVRTVSRKRQTVRTLTPVSSPTPLSESRG